MRNLQYSLPHDALESTLSLLRNTRIDARLRLTRATQCLGFSLDQFDKVRIEDQRDFLIYKYISTLVESYHYQKKLRISKHSLLDDILSTAYQSLLEYTTQNSNTSHSRFSLGLADIFRRTDQAVNLYQSIFPIGPKPGGIEPGFLATISQDRFINLFRACNEDFDSIKQVIASYQGNLSLIFEHVGADNLQYMFKLDYQKQKNSPKVVLSKDDTKRTGTVKRVTKRNKLAGAALSLAIIKAKASLPEDKNREAVLEVLANDIWRVFKKERFGENPSQTIYKTRYKNSKTLKLMIKSAMIKGAVDFGGNKSINKAWGEVCFGGGKNSKYRGRRACFQNAAPNRKNKKILTVSDNRIANMGSLYLPIILTGDEDKIGTAGQNLMSTVLEIDYKTGRETHGIVAIDFGHSYRGDKPLPTLYSNGQASKDISRFKNFSALSDAPFSEIIQSVFIFAKILGKPFDAKLLAVHYPEMKEMVGRVNQDEIKYIIQDYIEAFEQISQDEVDPRESQNLMGLLKSTEKTIYTNMEKIYNVYKDLLQYPPEIIDLNHNLTKLTAAYCQAASLVSKDGTHGLKHIRLSNPNFTNSWIVESKLNGDYVLSWQDSSVQNSQTLARNLKVFAKNNKVDDLALQVNNKKVSLVITEKNRALIVGLFTELNIKRQCFPKEHAAITRAYERLDLLDITRAPWFTDRNIKIELMAADETHSEPYIRATSLEPSINPIFERLFSEMIDNHFNSTSIFLEVPADNPKALYNQLLFLQNQYDLEILNSFCADLTKKTKTEVNVQQVDDRFVFTLPEPLHTQLKQEINEPGDQDELSCRAHNLATFKDKFARSFMFAVEKHQQLLFNQDRPIELETLAQQEVKNQKLVILREKEIAQVHECLQTTLAEPQALFVHENLDIGVVSEIDPDITYPELSNLDSLELVSLKTEVEKTDPSLEEKGMHTSLAITEHLEELYLNASPISAEAPETVITISDLDSSSSDVFKLEASKPAAEESEDTEELLSEEIDFESEFEIISIDDSYESLSQKIGEYRNHLLTITQAKTYLSYFSNSLFGSRTSIHLFTYFNQFETKTVEDTDLAEIRSQLDNRHSHIRANITVDVSYDKEFQLIDRIFKELDKLQKNISSDCSY